MCRAALAAAKFDSSALEAELLLCHYARCERAWLLAHDDELATGELVAAMEQATRRRLTHEPLQYITGRVRFEGLDLNVTPGCLVPRPETEVLVEAASERFSDGETLMDWGTGTGCIACALLSRFSAAHAFLVEKSPTSIACARKNLRELGLEPRATIVRSDNPTDIPVCSVSLLVANPPYVPTAAVDSLMPEVSHFEPRLALDGGSDGLALYEPLFVLGARVLPPGGFLCVEFGGDQQTEALRDMTPPTYVQDAILRDVAGHDRVFCWKFVGNYQ